MVSQVATGILVSTINQRVSNICTNVSSCLDGDLIGYDWLPCGHRHDHTGHIWRSERTHRSQWDHLVWVQLLNWHDSPCFTVFATFPHNLELTITTICGRMRFSAIEILYTSTHMQGLIIKQITTNYQRYRSCVIVPWGAWVSNPSESAHCYPKWCSVITIWEVYYNNA